MSIFISYRRQDSQYVTDRIYDFLTGFYDNESVFRDLDSIPLGQSFRTHIQDALNNCRVMLVIIGNLWLDTKDEDGNRRLENENDFVRIEIETAILRGIPVIPILISGTSVPAKSLLPTEIKSLSDRQAFVLRPGHAFNDDMEQLIDRLQESGLIGSKMDDLDDDQPFGLLGTF